MYLNSPFLGILTSSHQYICHCIGENSLNKPKVRKNNDKNILIVNNIDGTVLVINSQEVAGDCYLKHSFTLKRRFISLSMIR